MSKLSLRLRQVFEHPTHFKVVRPQGDPIKIAKKGLSATTIKRFQKLAHGGEVRNYANGGEVEIKEEGVELPVVVPPVEAVAPVIATTTPPAVAPLAPVAPTVVTPTAVVPVSTPTDPALKARADAAAQASFGVSFDNLSTQADRALVLEGIKPPPAPSIAAPPATPMPVAAPPAAAPIGIESREIPTTPQQGRLQSAQDALDIAKESFQKLDALPQPTTEAEKLEREGQRALASETVRTAEERVAELGRAELLDVESKRLQQQMTAQEARVAKDREFLDKAEKELADSKNVGSYFSRLDTWNKIGTSVSLALGALAAGMTGGANQAMRIYENAIESDLEKQRRDQQSLLNRIVRTGSRIDQAEEVVRALGQRAMAAKLDSAAATVASTKAKDGLAKLAFNLRAEAFDRLERMKDKDADNLRADAMLRVSQGDLALRRSADKRRDIELGLEAAKLGLEQKRLSAKESREAAEERQKIDDRTFYVAGASSIPLVAANPAEQRKASEQVLGQTDFIEGAEKALQVFKENPRMVYVPGSEARQLADLYLRQMLERYPKLERFGRPLNVTASKVIKGGIPSLDNFFQMVAGDPQLVIGELIRDAEEGRANAIRTYGARTPENAEEAIRQLEMGGIAAQPKPIKTLATTPVGRTSK